jgi:hypothetical protein
LSIACGCAGKSVCIEWTTHIASACFASSGNNSEIHIPLFPHWLNFHFDPSNFVPGRRPGLSLSTINCGL